MYSNGHLNTAIQMIRVMYGYVKVMTARTGEHGNVTCSPVLVLVESEGSQLDKRWGIHAKALFALIFAQLRPPPADETS